MIHNPDNGLNPPKPQNFLAGVAVAAVVIAGVFTLLLKAHNPNFFAVLAGVSAVLAVCTIPTLIWSELVEPRIRPHIYCMKNKGLFLYSKGNKRIVFEYMSLLKDQDNGGVFGGVNGLYIGTFSAVNEAKSYLAFDKNDEIIALLPYSKRYSKDSRDIVYVDAQGKRQWMDLENFINTQGNILNAKDQAPEQEKKATTTKRKSHPKASAKDNDWVVG